MTSINLINKFRLLVIDLKSKREMILITNISAYNEICIKNKSKYKHYLKLIVGKFVNQEILNNRYSNYLLYLSNLNFKPYSIYEKVLVIYCDILQLFFSLIFLIIHKRNKICYTSILNSRTLYCMDKIYSKRIRTVSINDRAQAILAYAK